MQLTLATLPHPGFGEGPRASRRTVAAAVVALHFGLAAVLWHQTAARLRAPAAPFTVSLRLDGALPAHRAEPQQADLPLPTRPQPLPQPQTLPIPEVHTQAAAPPVAVPTAEAPLQAAPTVAAGPVPIQAGPAVAAVVATVAPPPAATRARKEVAASAVSYLVLPPVEVPALSRRARESGTVWLRVVVDVRGLPIEVRLLRSSGHPRLDEQALWAMRQARFRPYTEDGLAVEVAVTAPVEYPLE